MGSLLVVLLGAGIIAFNRYLSEENGQTCPKCGRKARRVGKMIQRGSGKVVFSYKCDCGECWNSVK